MTMLNWGLDRAHDEASNSKVCMWMQGRTHAQGAGKRSRWKNIERRNAMMIDRPRADAAKQKTGGSVAMPRDFNRTSARR